MEYLFCLLYTSKREKDINKVIIIEDKHIDEKIISEILGTYKFVKKDEKYILKDSNEIYNFIKNAVPILSEKYRVFYSENFKIKKYETVSYHMSAKMTDLFEISFEVDGITKEEVYEVLKAIKEKKKYYILKNREMLLLGENKSMEELSKLLEEAEAKKSEIISGKIKREKAYGYFILNFLDRLNNVKMSSDMAVSYTHLDVYKRQDKFISSASIKEFIQTSYRNGNGDNRSCLLYTSCYTN